jgi:hypothetical protein
MGTSLSIKVQAVRACCLLVLSAWPYALKFC